MSETAKRELNRREALELLAAGSVLAGAGVLAFAQAAPADTPSTPAAGTGAAQAYRGSNEIKPLPFAPAKLRGLSEKLITSHHQNNYAGAVKRLNQIQQQIGALPVDAQPYQLGSLKREELIATNSMILHELYFDNLGGSGKPSGRIADLLKVQYGSIERWEAEFRLTCLSLGGGSGWAILNYSPRASAVHTYWSGDHSQNLAWGSPLLVMDMYEHAYHMDYGANAKGYVEAFFDNINWEAVNRRVEHAAARGVKP